MSELEHFAGCHPEDDHALEKSEGHTPQQEEACWHCGTPTVHGCDCVDCWNNAELVPPDCVYHCLCCGRWWAYMTGINVTTLTFPGNG